MCCVPLQTHRQQIQVSSSDGKGRCIVNVHICTHLMYMSIQLCTCIGVLVRVLCAFTPNHVHVFYCVHVLNSLCCVSLYTHGYVYLPCTCAGAQQVSSGGKGVYKCIEVSCMVMYVLYTHRWTWKCAGIIVSPAYGRVHLHIHAPQVSSGGKGVCKCIEVSCMVMYVLYTHRWTWKCAGIIVSPAYGRVHLHIHAPQVSSGGKGVCKCIEVSCMVMYVLYTHRWTCTCAVIIVSPAYGCVHLHIHTQQVSSGGKGVYTM